MVWFSIVEKMKSGADYVALDDTGGHFAPCLFSASATKETLAANETQKDNQETAEFKIPLQPTMKLKSKAKVKVPTPPPSLCADGTSSPGMVHV